MEEKIHEEQHILSYKLLAIVLFSLLVLTCVTVGISYVDMGFFNVPMALLVATVKSTLVLLFFMHLKFEGTLIVVSFTSTVIILCMLISFTFWDVAFR